MRWGCIRQGGEKTNFKEKYFEVWQEAWAFHKKYVAEFEKGTDFWEEAVYESSELLKKYAHKQQNFLKSLLTAVMSELQRNEKGG